MSFMSESPRGAIPNSRRAIPAARIDEFLAERFGVETTVSVQETAQ